jgi:hypothetical protein
MMLSTLACGLECLSDLDLSVVALLLDAIIFGSCGGMQQVEDVTQKTAPPPSPPPVL